jgi:hypothetical protein
LADREAERHEQAGRHEMAAKERDVRRERLADEREFARTQPSD